jgi:hypothetical protein
MKRTVLIILTAGLIALAGGVAYATIPDGQGVIHACYKPLKGDLRVIDSGSCASGELPLSWNQVGPQGPIGPVGPAGPAGPSGVETLTKSTAGAADKFFPADSNLHERLTLGRFTKLADATRVRITWQAPVAMAGPSSGSCTFQLRVDGAKDTGSTSPAIESNEGGDATLAFSGAGYREAPVADTAYFLGLTTGLHYITVWVRGTEPLDSCTTNAGGFPMSIVVEEMP